MSSTLNSSSPKCQSTLLLWKKSPDVLFWNIDSFIQVQTAALNASSMTNRPTSHLSASSLSVSGRRCVLQPRSLAAVSEFGRGFNALTAVCAAQPLPPAPPRSWFRSGRVPVAVQRLRVSAQPRRVLPAMMRGGPSVQGPGVAVGQAAGLHCVGHSFSSWEQSSAGIIKSHIFRVM